MTTWTPALFGSVYVAVLLAELVGDKTLYTMGALSARHAPRALLGGAGVAVAIKMLVAVGLGTTLTRLPAWLVCTASAGTFLFMGSRLLRPVSPRPTVPASVAQRARSGCITALATMLLTEWGDPGQITTALFAAHGENHALVWLAGSSAMFTKVLLSVTAGAALRRWVPVRFLRPLAAATFVLMAILTAFQVEV